VQDETLSSVVALHGVASVQKVRHLLNRTERSLLESRYQERLR
jgi:hypothetical protein